MTLYAMICYTFAARRPPHPPCDRHHRAPCLPLHCIMQLECITGRVGVCCIAGQSVVRRCAIGDAVAIWPKLSRRLARRRRSRQSIGVMLTRVSRVFFARSPPPRTVEDKQGDTPHGRRVLDLNYRAFFISRYLSAFPLPPAPIPSFVQSAREIRSL